MTDTGRQTKYLNIDAKKYIYSHPPLLLLLPTTNQFQFPTQQSLEHVTISSEELVDQSATR